MTLANAGGRNRERKPNAEDERRAYEARGGAKGGANAPGTGGRRSRAGDTQTHANHMAGDEKYHATLQKRKTRERTRKETAARTPRTNGEHPARTKARGNGPSLPAQETDTGRTQRTPESPHQGTTTNGAPRGTPTKRAPKGTPTTEPQRNWGTTPQPGAAQPRGAGTRGPAGK